MGLPVKPLLSVRLPAALTLHGPEVEVREALSSEQFDARQVEFIQAVFGYSALLAESARKTPTADAFLAAVVNLLETLHTNAPDEASVCALRLQQIIGAIFSPGMPALIDGVSQADGAHKTDGQDGASAL
ncbi:hypothetical protein [Paraburkholderia sp. DHOC27]|uniref:hypothetical protein n=1 Tax=Paraburkholderia sp. DHOC27 TaxID=2303330 RepID=UPI000E3C1AAB|nr:hypothetical protein [Paraburkholderia sp. DHOC27]RFU45953.1 hypothetical protein D0B32_20025 [Paraburkholderia sp. DHOC27]